MKISSNSLRTACMMSNYIVEVSQTINVSPFLLSSMIWHESRWNKKAISNKKACGLTQVLAKYSSYSCKELQDPKTSIKEGASILSFWKKKKSSISKALECYASGYHCNSPSYSRVIVKNSKLIQKTYNKIQKKYLWR
jgi:soluble lytic murein transglycosylase-like protein